MYAIVLYCGTVAYISELYALWFSFLQDLKTFSVSRMSAVSERTSNNNEEDESVFLAEIEELKKRETPSIN